MTEHKAPKLDDTGPTSKRLNILMASSTGPVSSPAFYERALRLSHNVMTFGPFRDRVFWESYANSFKDCTFYRDGTAEHWMDICSRLAKPCDIVTPQGMVDLRELKSKLPGNFEPDLILWIDQHELNLPIYFDAFQCPSVGLFGDTHLHLRGNWDVWRSYAQQFDYVFLSFNKHHMKHFEDAGCRRVSWSPAACDPAVHCRFKAEQIYPVSFVGGTFADLHSERVALLKSLKDRGVDIHIDSKVLHDMSLVFSRSKIVLNRSLADDLNMRVFEAMATGSMLLTNRLPGYSGLEELFVDGEHLVLYDDDNVFELIQYYLKNDEERERIATAGWKEVMNKHTYCRRVDALLRVLRDCGEAV